MDQASALRKLKEDSTRGQAIPSNSTTKIIAISSGKGGVGKTTLTVNIAMALAGMGRKVLIVDGDLGLANINVVLGIIPKHNLYHVIKGNKTLREIIIRTPEGIDFIPGASGYTQLANLDESQRNSLIKSFSELENYDYIFIDTGAGITANVIGLILPADELIVITTPDPTSITDSYGLVKSVVTHSKSKKISILINRVRSESEGKKVASRVIGISEKFLGVKLRELGMVFHDDEVEKSVRAQKPFLTYAPRCKATECILRISEEINKDKKNPSNGKDEQGISDYFKKFFSFSDHQSI